jgi:hypothetical protein
MKKLLNKIDSNILRYIVYGIILVAVVIIIRCERQNTIHAEYKYIQSEKRLEILDMEYKARLIIINKLNKEYDLLVFENNMLRDSINHVDSMFNDMSKHELKREWANYKGHNMRIAR